MRTDDIILRMSLWARMISIVPKLPKTMVEKQMEGFRFGSTGIFLRWSSLIALISRAEICHFDTSARCPTFLQQIFTDEGNK